MITLKCKPMSNFQRNYYDSYDAVLIKSSRLFKFIMVSVLITTKMIKGISVRANSRQQHQESERTVRIVRKKALSKKESWTWLMIGPAGPQQKAKSCMCAATARNMSARLTVCSSRQMPR